MAHQIDLTNSTHGAMAYVGDTPWHKLGTKVLPDDSLEKWQEAAGLNWEAQRSLVRFTIPGPQTHLHEVDDKYVLYRDDTKAPLSIVSDRYRVVQPRDVLDFFKIFVEETGQFEMETLGALQGGKKIWGLARAKDSTLNLAGDKIARYLLMATSFDGSLSTTIQQTSVRVVCNNTLSLSMARGERLHEPSIRLTHLSQFKPADIVARMTLEEDWEAFSTLIDLFARRSCNALMARAFFTKALDLKPANDGKLSRSAWAKLAHLEDIRQAAPGWDTKSAKNTMWGVANAVTYYVDHVIKSKSQGARLDKAWFGEGKHVKTRVMAALLEAA